MKDFERLELSTETLRELSGEELIAVAGGAAKPDTVVCLTGNYTNWCPTVYNCIQYSWAC